MNNELKVRIGTPADVHAVMDIALACAAENGLTNPNPIKLLQEVWAGLHQDGSIIGVIGESHEYVEAAILLRVESLWYSDDKSLIERAIIVRPEYRQAKGGRAKLLCEFAKKVAGKLDVPLLIGVLSNQRTEGKVRLYERQFGPSAGAYWIYGGKTGGKADHIRDALSNQASIAAA